MVVVVDDASRENEGDLILAAEKATRQKHKLHGALHFRRHLRADGLASDLDRLELPLMTQQNMERMRTAYTISVDAARGVTTGISAADRAHTIQLLANPKTQPDDLVRPGHIFPLRYREGGVLRRAGHTEAAIDLARLAGLRPAGVHRGNRQRRRLDVASAGTFEIRQKTQTENLHRRRLDRIPPHARKTGRRKSKS